MVLMVHLVSETRRSIDAPVTGRRADTVANKRKSAVRATRRVGYRFRAMEIAAEQWTVLRAPPESR